MCTTKKITAQKYFPRNIFQSLRFLSLSFSTMCMHIIFISLLVVAFVYAFKYPFFVGRENEEKF